MQTKSARLEFLKIYEDLYLEYKNIDISQIVIKEKQAFWIEGDPKISKALFLAHGYMGSPSEMMFMAKPFIETGWSIIGFLIPGHGSSSEVANAFKNSRWQNEMARQLQIVTDTFQEVRAIGFSTGGLLLHDYLINHSTPKTLKSLHLISPYFVQKLPTIDWAVKLIFNNMSVDTAYALTHFPDLKVMTIDRNFYNQSLPIMAAKEIKELGLEVFNKTFKGPKIQLPTQLFLSKGDWTVKTNASKKVIARDIETHELIWFKGHEPHHLMAPSVSKVAKEIQTSIFHFVK
ncbi:MAG: alpha/beta fold hydrolase [Bacteriovorax sp.]|nr:alpha/beta fold hydrolase [Bacteriovorax sp.]